MQHSVSVKNGSAPGQPPMHQSATADNSIYIRETIRAIRPDSSIDLNFKFDSMSVKLQQDTIRIRALQALLRC
jgi:hypothetical protein